MAARGPALTRTLHVDDHGLDFHVDDHGLDFHEDDHGLDFHVDVTSWCITLIRATFDSCIGERYAYAPSVTPP